MNLERLSSNIVDVINEVLSNQNLVNYIGYDGNLPLTIPINPSDIAPKGTDQRIYPYPFDINITGEVRSSLHIYYPNFQFKNNGYANEVALIFDVVVHKSIWLMEDNGKKLIRPYQIVKYLVDTFKDKRVSGIGEIHFLDGSHTLINSDFEGVRLVAQFTEF